MIAITLSSLLVLYGEFSRFIPGKGPWIEIECRR